MSSKKANPPPPLPLRAPVALLVLGLAESALALFQWSQLLTLRQGGSTVCGVSERVNCETVWNSPFASALHELFRIPVAALGLVWGIAAVALSALFLAWRSSGANVRPATNGLRLTALVGVVSSAVFAAASAASGALCLTCLGTYALVLVFAGVAWRGLPGPVLPQAGEWASTLQWAGGFTVAAYLAVLVPGMNTPQSDTGKAALASAPVAATADELGKWVQGLPLAEQQALSNALALYKLQQARPASAPARRVWGRIDAPVRMVEWTDSKCPHCKHLVEDVALLKKRLPQDKISIEARQYPLDAACNHTMPAKYTDGTGVRCVAAKAQICLEDAPDYWELRERLFAVQSSLDSAKVLEIASSGSVPREKLQACIESPETARKLKEDIDYAQQYGIRGTPLVLLNGRQAMPVPSLMYALAVAGGDANAPAFRSLPPPNLSAQDHMH